MQDITNQLHVKPAFEPKAAVTDNTAAVGSIIDLLGFDGAMLAIITGTDADADATFALTIDHGDASNLSDAAAVVAADLNGTLAGGGYTFADDVEARKVGYVGKKRYVRATVTPSANTGNFFIGGLWILGHARFGPTAFPS